MRRRKLLERIGAASVAATGAAGVVSADKTRGLTHVRWEVNGKRQTFELQEFHAHPETPSLRELENVTSDDCPSSAECCECLDCLGCDGLCGDCTSRKNCGENCDCCSECDVC